ncbi:MULTISPECIES: hypothetical protein [Serratia]|nr:hypothetical protein [Serratia marcescens]HEJ7948074.1 hypothetical protein [Serratia liquefaciens]EJD6705157.1 hypothetical protein [Serratia marcescens]CVB58135.1 Uncharacterised protein [Serratia marcescens]CVB61512.1 Uncharacterised protein [Serratia marcescens]CVC69580.1 Uncharacterised protein [Serratia marcescens]
MGQIIGLSEPYRGWRSPVDLTGKYIDPETIFSNFKSRVLADGGVIHDENGLKERINLLIDHNMLNKIVVAASPRFGVKVDADGVSVRKVYGLNGQDFIAVQQQYQQAPALPLPIYNPTAGSVRVKVASYSGGYLRTENLVSVITGSATTYAIQALANDTDPMDQVGLTLGLSLSNLGLAYMRTIASPYSTGTREAWRYGTRDGNYTGASSGSGAGGAVLVKREPYEAYVPSAAFFDVNNGVITAYENGCKHSDVTTPVGKLANVTAPGYVIIGSPIFDSVGGGSYMQTCDGSFKDLIILRDPLPIQAQILSTLN